MTRRKRGPVAEQVAAAETTSQTDDTSFNPAEFEPASPRDDAQPARAEPRPEPPAPDDHAPHITLADVVHAPAEHLAGHNIPPQPESAPAAVVLAEPAPAEHTEPARSHAESVGRREPVVVNSGLTGLKNDLLAGVKYAEGFRLVGGRKLRDSVITFAEKPSPEVIAAMKDAGFQWQPADKVWTHPIRPDTAMQDRLHGERVFEQASAMVRSERGIEHSAGVAVG